MTTWAGFDCVRFNLFFDLFFFLGGEGEDDIYQGVLLEGCPLFLLSWSH